MFDQFVYGRSLPFHFWTPVFFLLGAIVGSFLNVCIHRMPRGESLVTPGSHCPQCNRAIPLRLNVPLVSWLWLRGRCAFCGARIRARYFLVELLTATMFLLCWLRFGEASWAQAIMASILISGLIAATFIDFEHFIIPDEITLGGVGVGLLASFLVPEMHGQVSPAAALLRSAAGAALGAGGIYGTLRLGKLLFGRQKLTLAPRSRVIFGELELRLPDRSVPYHEILYRDSDTVILHAHSVEMADRCYWSQMVRVTRSTLRVGDEEFATESVPGFEVVTDGIVVPREAMGLGDVKFMAAIGAFTGWLGVVFTVFGSAVLGSAVGLLQVALRRHDRAKAIPYGPYLAMAAVLWVFEGERMLAWWLSR